MIDLQDRLVEKELITQEQLTAALLESSKTGRSLWFTLVKLEYLSEERIVRFFAQEANIPFVRLSDYHINQSVLNTLDENFCRFHNIIPLFRSRDAFVVACNNPFDTDMLDIVGKLSGSLVEPVMATASDINHALDYYWKLDSLNFVTADLLVKAQPLKGITFWRESERMLVDWPVSLSLRDSGISLAASAVIEGRGHDITRDGSAIGVYVPVYLPKGVNVSVKVFPSGRLTKSDDAIQICGAVGAIVHSHAYRQDEYLIGIRFVDIDDAARKYLIGRAELTK